MYVGCIEDAVMSKPTPNEPPLIDTPLEVTAESDEVVISGPPHPSLSANAARETGGRLIDAADKLQAS